ncbi:MAG: hypothetical protein IJC43_06370 [Clostridia bacterium]|nr:hypothetical protein [Clostridia bacterium]
MFRSSFRGFHKDDVNRYIAELSKRMEETELTCRQAEEASETMRRSLELSRAEADSLKKQAESLERQLASLQANNELLYKKNRTYAEEKTAALQREQQLLARVAELEAQLPTLEAAARRYDSQAQLIAETLVDARVQSDRLLRTAGERAELVRQQLRGEVARVSDSVDRMAESYRDVQDGISRYSLQMKAMMESLLEELLRTRRHLDALDLDPLLEQREPLFSADGGAGSAQAAASVEGLVDAAVDVDVAGTTSGEDATA